MMDFLTFKSFISLNTLIVFYLIGALIMPFVSWAVSQWVMRKFPPLSSLHSKTKTLLWRTLNNKEKALFLFCAITCFFFAELFWRMMFEYLIAFMQMHHALVR